MVMRIGDLDALEAKFIELGNIITSYDGAASAAYVVNKAPTIDPVHAAGGCYCRECCFGRTPCSEDMRDGYVYCQQQSWYKQFDAFCSDGEPKETRK